MLSSRLLAVLSLVGIVAAFPQVQVRPDDAAECPQTICVDGINTECSRRWGGCYDRCKPEMRPTMPPCKSTLTQSVVFKTPHPFPPIWSLPMIRLPLQTRIPPSRGPSSRTTTNPLSPPTARPTPSDNCSTRTVCVDYINECGQMYGGCHADCKPWPTYAKPSCKPSLTINPSTPPTQY